MSRTFPNISKKEFFKACDYWPHGPEQASYHNSEARFRVPTCGRRWGKSKSTAMDMAYHCFTPDAYFWIVGPTYKLAEKEYRVIYDVFMRKLKREFEGRVKATNNAKQGDMRMEFEWGTVLECVSATNTESLLGEGLHGCIMSEAARHTLETWEAYIEPALSDFRGFADFPSTPKGFNWYQGMYQLGQSIDPKLKDYESWNFPTWTNLLRYPGGYEDDELTRIRDQASPNWWRQEYGAEFVVFEGQIYDNFNSQLHVKRIDYNPRWKNYLALDFGFSAPFVCLDIMVDPADNVYVWREYQKRYLTTGEHGVYLKHRDNPDNYHYDGVYADPHGADEIATIRPFLGAIHSPVILWENAIEEVKRKIKLKADGTPGLFIDPSCIELIRQLQGLRFKTTKGERDAKEGQHDYDDHGPDALRYFIGPYFILGSAGLGDVYAGYGPGSEGESFFVERAQVVLDKPLGYG